MANAGSASQITPCLMKAVAATRHNVADSTVRAWKMLL
jgi:hypothetical protein